MKYYDFIEKKVPGFTYFEIEENNDDWKNPGWTTRGSFKTFEKGLEGLKLYMKEYISQYIDEEEFDIEAIFSGNNDISSLLGEDLDKYADPRNYRLHVVSEELAVLQFRDPHPFTPSVETEESDVNSLFKALKSMHKDRTERAAAKRRNEGETEEWKHIGIRLIKKQLMVVE